MEPHQRRVVEERHELSRRIDRLDDFIENSPLFLELDEKEQERMTLQSMAMKLYLNILKSRIANFKFPDIGLN